MTWCGVATVKRQDNKKYNIYIYEIKDILYIVTIHHVY